MCDRTFTMATSASCPVVRRAGLALLALAPRMLLPLLSNKERRAERVDAAALQLRLARWQRADWQALLEEHCARAATGRAEAAERARAVAPAVRAQRLADAQLTGAHPDRMARRVVPRVLALARCGEVGRAAHRLASNEEKNDVFKLDIAGSTLGGAINAHAGRAVC
jgi:hypothetical protein